MNGRVNTATDSAGTTVSVLSEHRRPVLGIVYGQGSSSPFALSESASPMCDIVWVIDSNEFDDRLVLRLLRKLGQTVDIAGLSEDEAVEALRPLQLDGIVAYADAHMGTASALADRLGLDYHDRAVAERLLDKVTQRKALRTGGLPVPRCDVVPADATSDAMDALVDEIAYPVVLKPRHGAASKDTHLVHDGDQLRTLVAEQGSSGPEPTMVVEEYMVGAAPPPSSQFSDYVSVESVVAEGQISHLAVTGRLPQDEPFRETGLIIPTDFAPPLVGEVLDIATTALLAMGVRTGCFHTEIKIIDKGPRVIEVNGRLGGFVPEVLQLAAPAVNLFEISQRVALGEKVVSGDVVPTDQIGYVVARQPPLWARRVESVDGLDELAAYPGVDAVSLSRPPGDEVDWRKGSHEYVFSVLGSVPTYEDMRALQRFVDEDVTVTYS
jgi:predicted ATP-grasp superfamily ATP-dependent carboligase